MRKVTTIDVRSITEMFLTRRGMRELVNDSGGFGEQVDKLEFGVLQIITTPLYHLISVISASRRGCVYLR